MMGDNEQSQWNRIQLGQLSAGKQQNQSYTQDAPAPVAPVAPIQSEIEGLLRDVALLRDRTDTLINRLIPVSLPRAIGSEANGAISKAPTVCEIANGIQAAARQVRETSDSLSTAIDMLQI